MSQVGKLLCGHSGTAGIARTALKQLSSSIEDFAAKASMYHAHAGASDAIRFSPFCSRALLENSYAALMGRLDCFRLLYLSEFQSQVEYEHTRRARSSFSWLGDIFSDEKPVQDLWSMEHDVLKINRALLSRHSEHLYWKPAVNQMLDFLATRSADPLLADIRVADAESFIPKIKGRSMRLYSELSKGVHWEFFSSVIPLDKETIQNNIRETFSLIADLGLASHFIPTAYASLSPEDAIAAYLAVRKDIL